MRTFSVAAFLAAVGTALAQSQSLLINTPTVLYQCQPYLLTWGGGSAPYYVRVVPGGSLSGPVLATLDEQPTSDTSFTWTVNIAAGTEITLTLTDSTGAQAATAPVTIQPGDDSCLGVSSSSGLASSGSATNSQSAPSTTSIIESSTGSAASSSASSAASSISSAASSSASSVSSMASSMSSSMSSASQTSQSTSGSNTASGTAPSQTASGDSGAGRVAAGSALAFVAGALALAA
ncbi:hypothetical protein DMC30DRAFT_416572 [Rhodotorula diobovata]|uniref:Ser-Thr-rich glycosyl-phosphatidyl-inositol-anchored membrane family-domain-containing protein n=1 Tax=Rhodotorula diobovata TaxID=5288 RepID=A0A5C5FVV8_9BASI|nr:hypothetical protein DMC30DRAFT_416572 [Rhodotorula diobovata]